MIILLILVLSVFKAVTTWRVIAGQYSKTQICLLTLPATILFWLMVFSVKGDVTMENMVIAVFSAAVFGILDSILKKPVNV